MKKIFTSLCATLLAVAASAQVTATISPSDKNVYVPDTYGFVSVTYSDTVNVASAVATVTCNGVSTTLTTDSTTTLQSLFKLEKAAKALNVSNGDIVTVTVSGVSGVSSVSASYKYYSTMPEPAARPAAGSTLSAKNDSVVFSFSESLACPYIQYASGNVLNTDTLDANLSTSVTAKILTDYWDASASDITVTLVGATDSAGFVYPPYEAKYYYAETANYLGVYPDPDLFSYDEIYNNDTLWYVYFKYDKYIEAPEDENATLAVVTFYDDTETMVLETVPLDLWSVNVVYRRDWQCYAVEVAIPEVPTTAVNYGVAAIQLQGFTYNNTSVYQPVVYYYAEEDEANAKVVKGDLNGIQGIVDAGDNVVTVYNLQGLLVKKNIQVSELSSLAKGLYVINGKKITIK